MKFPLSKEEWYTARDDRTRRVDGASGFDRFSVGVVVDPKVRTSYSTQIMALTTLNILARWCRKITVQMPSQVFPYMHRQEGQDLTRTLQTMMSDADPYGEFSFDDEVVGDGYDQLLVIGDTEKDYGDSVWIDASGWIAGVGYGLKSTLKTDAGSNPVGSTFASCLGVAELFRRATGLSEPKPHSRWYSLYAFSNSEKPGSLSNPEYVHEFDFGKIHQVGCGAVGSSLDFLLSLTNWKAEINLIDFDKIDPTNCNRSPAFTAYDAVTEKNKIDVCAGILANGTITPVAFNGDYSQFISQGKFLDNPPNLILSLANERNVWADIQHNCPPIVLHATTTPNWGVNFGRHIPKKEWCILCRFSDEITHEFTPPCSEGEIRGESNGDNGDKPIQGVLPFLSTMGASMILAEMAKLASSTYPVNKNFIEFSARYNDGGFVQGQRSPKPDCVCNTQHVSGYPNEIQASKFWGLVENASITPVDHKDRNF